MKQNGARLVQRKFAQGVPIPTGNSGVAPLPPERKPEPTNSPKNLYHNNISATNLLDIISMQNVHRHKQDPLVVLERLKVNEIPSPPVPKVRKRPQVNKDMCLRSGKRKPDAAKGLPRKRRKLTSESTDDLPLLYYFTEPQAKPGSKPRIVGKTKRPLNRPKRNAAPKRKGLNAKKRATAKENTISETNNLGYTFKEPTHPARVSYRIFNKKAAKIAGRALRKSSLSSRAARCLSLRSSNTPAERATGLLGKKSPQPAVRKGSKTLSIDEQPPLLPSGWRLLRDSSIDSDMSSNISVCGVREPRPYNTFLADIDAFQGDIPSLTNIDTQSATEQPDWCINASINPQSPSTRSSSSVIEDDLFLPLTEEWNPIERVDAVNNANTTTVQIHNSKEGNKDSQTRDNQQTEQLKKTVANNENNTIRETGQPDWFINDARIKPESLSIRTSSINIKEDIFDETDDLFLPLAEEWNPERVDAEKNANTTTVQIHNSKEGNKDSQTRDNQQTELGAGKRREELVASNSGKHTGHPQNDIALRQALENETRVEDTPRRDETLRSEDLQTTVAKNAVEKNTIKKTGRKPAAKPSVKEMKKTRPKRGAKNAPEKAPAPSTRLLRNSRERQPPNPDVYEFDAELEASRPPSSLRRRGQATPDLAPAAPPAPPAPPAATPPTPESVDHVDILPQSSRCIQNKSTDQPVEDQISQKNRNLIENLSSRPELLNKFFNTLPAALQNELGELISAEGLTNQAACVPKQEPGAHSGHKAGSAECVLEAPTFRPTAEEFADPIQYYNKIAPVASRYGLCKIVPPEGFEPPCKMSETFRFTVIYQYITKMFNRWGPVAREQAAIKAHLRSQSVVFDRPPLVNGSEVSLPKLFHTVETCGGLNTVTARKRWRRVADLMKMSKSYESCRKLDTTYIRYVLPYAMLSAEERKQTMVKVENCWKKKYQRILERARNPFHRQNTILGTECESESDDDEAARQTAWALKGAEDCVVEGRSVNLARFKKIAAFQMNLYFGPNKQPPSDVEVEKLYWRAVQNGTDYIVASTASIDTGEEGYGFPKDPDAEYGSHPWNPKVLVRNPNNALRYLGDVLGVTVPTLHVNMLFSTSCWHRDPHGLPWMEYMHSGAEKIWYGIPQDESAKFRRAVEILCPANCLHKAIWLASEITMVPPGMLSDHGVRLSRLRQLPGEYVMVFPEAHSCSINTGFGLSESVYFGSNMWLSDAYKLFQELRNSCEPTMFSLEQLLVAGSEDPNAPPEVRIVLSTLLGTELDHRRVLEQKGLKLQVRPASPVLDSSYSRPEDECEFCRCTPFFSKVTGLIDKVSTLCPEHTIRILETRKYKDVDLSTLEFVSCYSTCALEEMLERIEFIAPSPEESRASSVIDLTGEATPSTSKAV